MVYTKFLIVSFYVESCYNDVLHPCSPPRYKTSVSVSYDLKNLIYVVMQ